MIFISNYLLTWRYIDSFLYETFFKFLDIKRNISNLAKNFYTYLNKSIEKPNQPTGIFDFQTVCTYLCIHCMYFHEKIVQKSLSFLYIRYTNVLSISNVIEAFWRLVRHDFISTIPYYTIIKCNFIFFIIIIEIFYLKVIRCNLNKKDIIN